MWPGFVCNTVTELPALSNEKTNRKWDFLGGDDLKDICVEVRT